MKTVERLKMLESLKKENPSDKDYRIIRQPLLDLLNVKVVQRLSHF